MKILYTILGNEKIPHVMFYNNNYSIKYRRENPVESLIKNFYYKGKLHRINGPAVIGHENIAYYIHGVRYNYATWRKICRKFI